MSKLTKQNGALIKECANTKVIFTDGDKLGITMQKDNVYLCQLDKKEIQTLVDYIGQRFGQRLQEAKAESTFKNHTYKEMKRDIEDCYRLLQDQQQALREARSVLDALSTVKELGSAANSMIQKSIGQINKYLGNV